MGKSPTLENKGVCPGHLGRATPARSPPPEGPSLQGRLAAPFDLLAPLRSEPSASASPSSTRLSESPSNLFSRMRLCLKRNISDVKLFFNRSVTAVRYYVRFRCAASRVDCRDKSSWDVEPLISQA